MGLRSGLDQMKQGLADMMNDRSFLEIMQWCEENGLPTESSIDQEYFHILGLIAAKLMRHGCPPETVGVYIAAIMTHVEQSLPEGIASTEAPTVEDGLLAEVDEDDEGEDDGGHGAH